MIASRLADSDKSRQTTPRRVTTHVKTQRIVNESANRARTPSSTRPWAFLETSAEVHQPRSRLLARMRDSPWDKVSTRLPRMRVAAWAAVVNPEKKSGTPSKRSIARDRPSAEDSD